MWKDRTHLQSYPLGTGMGLKNTDNSGTRSKVQAYQAWQDSKGNICVHSRQVDTEEEWKVMGLSIGAL